MRNYKSFRRCLNYRKGNKKLNAMALFLQCLAISTSVISWGIVDRYITLPMSDKNFILFLGMILISIVCIGIINLFTGFTYDSRINGKERNRVVDILEKVASSIDALSYELDKEQTELSCSSICKGFIEVESYLYYEFSGVSLDFENYHILDFDYDDYKTIENMMEQDRLIERLRHLPKMTDVYQSCKQILDNTLLLVQKSDERELRDFEVVHTICTANHMRCILDEIRK